MNQTQSAQVKPSSQMESAQTHLAEVVERLLVEVTSLRNRLHPVLMPAHPETAKEAGLKEIQQMRSPIADHLYTMASQVQLALGTVADIEARLEL